MESVDHFYLTLPSSASLDLHPDNKLSDFTTELMNPIQLERGMYEVGLCEMILDANIENLPQTRHWIMIYRDVEYVKTTLKITNISELKSTCLLYTSDAADERSSV